VTRENILDINEASVRGQFVITGFVEVLTYVWGSLNVINLRSKMQAECFKRPTDAPPKSAHVWNCRVRFPSESQATLWWFCGDYVCIRCSRFDRIPFMC
jgi:hypothetical protein